jgi:hypothetical protein
LYLRLLRLVGQPQRLLVGQPLRLLLVGRLVVV